MARRNALVVHLFRPTRHRNHEGTRICVCGSLETDSVHKLPETEPSWKALEARRIGDHDEED